MFDFAIVVPIIVALVSTLKITGLPGKFAPLASLALGVMIFSGVGSGDIVGNIFEGVVAGLTASGLYSGTKSVIE